MNKSQLHQIIYSQQKEFNSKSNLINRVIEKNIYKLIKAKLPIIITGVRRCGKSSMLKLLKKDNSLYINFNDERLLNFSTDDFQKIRDYLEEQNYSQNTTLFLDEIQETNGWEKWIDRIKDKYNIFITGSNSKLLSGEFSSRLTGRAVSIKMYPFNLEEILKIKKIDISNWKLDTDIQLKIKKIVKEYLKFGGFPQYILTQEKIIISELYENILYKDIISRFNKNQIKNIREIMQFIISNISKPISIRNLSEISGISNLKTVKQILEMLEDAYLIFSINKFDFSIKKQIQNPKKIYCIDNGILSTRGFNFSENNGRLLENLVFLKLKQSNREIYYHKDEKECDFIIKEKNKIIEALQVCYHLNPDNKKREISGLNEAIDKYNLKKGTIITFEQEEKINNIDVVPAWKFLLNY